MNLNPLFNPKTLAVIGVSRNNDRNPANVVFNKNWLHYPLEVYAVNPAGGLLQGRPIYKDIAEVPQKIDLAVISVRAGQVPETLSACIAAGVSGAAVISAGFAEVGRADLQQQCIDIAAAHDFPFVGPNCLGIYAPGWVDTFFLPAERMVRPGPGNVAIVSQSGGVLVDQIVKFADEGLGLSLGVSIGNKAVIGEMALLSHLENDPATDVIAFYLEGFGQNQGRRFVLAAGKCQKPVIVLKAGKTDLGQKAVASHTAALAGDYSALTQIFAQHGIVEAKSEFELINFCKALSRYPRSVQGRLGIITCSGGHGALAVDACAGLGLAVPSFSDKMQTLIREKMSPNIRDIAAVQNPVDVTGSAVDEDFVAVVDSFSRSAEIDAIILLMLPYTPGITMDLGARLSRITVKRKKPLIAYVPRLERYKMMIEGFEFNGVPVANSIQGAILMAEAMRRNQSC